MSKKMLGDLDKVARAKGIDTDQLVHLVQTALTSAASKYFGEEMDVRVVFDRESGGIRVLAPVQVVDKVENKLTEISVKAARKIVPAAKAGQTVDMEIDPREFGRIAAQTAKHVVLHGLKDAENSAVYRDFQKKIGTIMPATVRYVSGKNVIVNLGTADGILPPKERSPRDSYGAGDHLKVYITRVTDSGRGPAILVSRRSPRLVAELFRQQVEEISQGLVEIRSVAREPGERTKIAVQSTNPNIDATGACIGVKGSRVLEVVKELGGEKIDVIAWSDDPGQLIRAALSPAEKVRIVKLDMPARRAVVAVPDRQLSLAIGRQGKNARLASRLSGWHIDITSESQAQLASQQRGK